MEKTLYLSDLDGTLLLPNERLSEFTVNQINDLTERGLLFSYATARSFVTAAKVTHGLSRRVPAIIYNGAFVLDNGRFLYTNFFEKEQIEALKKIIFSFEAFPLVYAFAGGKERFSYLTSYHTKGQDAFIASRNDFRKTPVQSTDQLFTGDIFYLTFIGETKILEQIYFLVKDHFTCFFQKDIYSGEQWLEILPLTATKAHAALKLKKQLGCSRLVAFGDGINDIPLFQAADACYAVENAHPKLKKLADGIIESNTNDGVAKFLLEEAEKTHFLFT